MEKQWKKARKTKYKPQKLERRCWHTEIGNKRRQLCNDDPINKRMYVRADVYQHLQNCDEAIVDGRHTTYVRPEELQYAIQGGSVKSVKCTRRQTGRRCWNAKIQRNTRKANTHIIPICENDPIKKKIDIMDGVDETLMGCNTARFWYEYEKPRKLRKPTDSFTISRKGGLNSIDRNMAGLIMVQGQAKQVRCEKKSKRR